VYVTCSHSGAACCYCRTSTDDEDNAVSLVNTWRQAGLDDFLEFNLRYTLSIRYVEFMDPIVSVSVCVYSVTVHWSDLWRDLLCCFLYIL